MKSSRKTDRPWYLLPGLLLFGLSIPGFIVLDSSSTAYTRLQREQEASHLAGNLQVILVENQGQEGSPLGENLEDPAPGSLAMPGRPGRFGPGVPDQTRKGVLDANGLTVFAQAADAILGEETGSGIQALGIWLPRSGMAWKTGKDTRDLDSLPLLDRQWQRLPYGDLVFHVQDGSGMLYLRPLLRGPARRMAMPDPEIRGIFLVQAWRGGDLVWAGTARRILVWTMAGLVWAALLAMMLLLRRNQILQENLGRTEVLVRAGQAARTLAHEVRTPLAIILLQYSLLKKELDARHHPALDRIQTEARRIQNLSATLARMVRQRPDGAGESPGGSASSQGSGEVENPGKADGPGTDMVQWIDGVVSPGTWPGLQILPGPALVAWAGEEVLFTIVSNLLNNAREADPATPLEISWRFDPPLKPATAGYMELSVRDLAGGMSWLDKKRIFDPFFSTKESGMGLGLKLSRDMARSSGGDLTCRFRHARDSHGKRRKGMEFTLRIPASSGKARTKDPKTND